MTEDWSHAELRRAMIEGGVPEAMLADILRGDEPVWDTDAARRDFAFDSFLAPMAFVTRRSDGVRGALTFTHHPRFYFNFKPLQEGT